MHSTRFSRTYLSIIVLFCFPILLAAQKLKIQEVGVPNSNATGTLSGTLTTVQNARKMRAEGILAILLPGSGPTDRHGNSGPYPMLTLDLVAAECHAQGISTLQFDKRGIGASTYEGTEAEMTYSDLVQDILQWWPWTLGFSRIFIIGHSEGGQMALTLAAKHPEFPVHGLILLAAPAEPAADILWRQLQRQMDPTSEYGRRAKSALDSLQDGLLFEGAVPMALQSLFRPSVQPYLVDWFKDDPIHHLKLCEVRLPVYFFYGGKGHPSGADGGCAPRACVQGCPSIGSTGTDSVHDSSFEGGCSWPTNGHVHQWGPSLGSRIRAKAKRRAPSPKGLGTRRSVIQKKSPQKYIA